MKKSEFIKKVLKSQSNTVLTTEEQVENAIEVFERYGMLPPENGTDNTGYFHEWGEE